MGRPGSAWKRGSWRFWSRECKGNRTHCTAGPGAPPFLRVMWGRWGRTTARGAGKESPSHGVVGPGPFRQGGRGDGGCGLPRARCALAMTLLLQEGRYGIGGRTEASAPTEVYLAVRRGGALPLPRAGKSAKRRRWRMQRAGFEEVPRLADTTVAGNRLARRWAREPRPYGRFNDRTS